MAPGHGDDAEPAASEPTRRPGDAVEYTVHESRRPRAAEPVGQTDGLVNRHLGRRLAAPELLDREPQDVALDHAIRLMRQFSTRGPLRRRASSTSATTRSPAPRRRRGGRLGPVRRESPAASRGWARPKLPGVQQLERAGATAGLNPEHGSPAAGRSRLQHRGRRGRGLVAFVSRAPAGPLHGLLQGVHGEHAEADRHRVQAGDVGESGRGGPPATYSKCGVSPRITAPSATRQA